MGDFVGFYTQVIFPRLCDLLLNRPFVARHRRELLAHAYGEVLEIGFGTGLNLPLLPGGRAQDHDRRSERRDALARPQADQADGDRGGPAGSERRAASRSTDGTFDCVVSTFTLCSIAGVGQALSEVYRVLKPGGRFLFLEHGLSPEPSVQKWQRRLNWLEMRLADGCRLDRDIRGIVTAQPFSSLSDRSVLHGRIPQDARLHVPWDCHEVSTVDH